MGALLEQPCVLRVGALRLQAQLSASSSDKLVATGYCYSRLVRQAAQETQRQWLCTGNAAEVAGCSGTRSVGETEEHEVIAMTSWFAGTVKQGKAGTGRKAGPQEGKSKGGQADPTGEPLLPPRYPKKNGSCCVAASCFYVLRLFP